MAMENKEEVDFWLHFKIVLFFVGAGLVLLWLFISIQAIRAYEPSEFQRAGVIAQVSALMMFTAAFSGFPADKGDLQTMQDHFDKIGPEGIKALFDKYGNDTAQNEKFVRLLKLGGGPKPVLLGIKSTALFVEIAILLLGTLQTGYGDWFLCSINDGSMSKCRV